MTSYCAAQASKGISGIYGRELLITLETTL